MRGLDGKVAIVTGAGGGIGAATVAVLAERGARVVAADIDFEAAERTAAEVGRTGAAVLALQVDLAEEESIRAMVDQVARALGRIDILDNNAAIQGGLQSAADLSILTLDVAAWDRAFRINARGAMLCCRHVIPHMLEVGGGAIVNIASNLGLQGGLRQTAYSASKAAIMQLTRSIATSHGKLGIRCNAVAPGLVLTPGAMANVPAHMRELVLSETLTPYLGEPRDIAYVVAFLVSDEARYITGQTIVADGGTVTHAPGFAAQWLAERAQSDVAESDNSL